MVDVPFGQTRERFPLEDASVSRKGKDFSITFPRVKRLAEGRTEIIETTIVLSALALGTAVYLYKKGKK